jgi:hypothetical protein
MKEIKLSKDQIQKLSLSAIGFVMLLYVYFSFFLGPLDKSRHSMLASIQDLQKKLGTSKSEMTKASNLEKQAATATTLFASLKARSPEGAPIAWFPPRIKLFFANQHIEKVTARLENSAPFKEPELANWARYTWTIDLPQADFAVLGTAIASLENSEPLLSIIRVNIHVLPEDPQFQQVGLTVTNAILKR